MANVSLRRLAKTYAADQGRPPGAPAVHDVFLEVADKEFLVLAGPRGSGKSTLLRLVAGLETPDAGGEILLGGKPIQDLPAHGRDVAMVFADGALYPHLTVAENLGFALKMRGARDAEIKKRVAEAANILDLGPLLPRYPEDLSSGERQRVALGRAVVRQPKVFLLDEPLAALDHPARLEARAGLIQLHQRLQATTIYATHDPVDALTLGSRVAGLQAGAMVQTGTPLQVYQEPENLFVAGFVGAPPMNLIPGKLSEKNGLFVFKEAGGGVVEVRFREGERPGLKSFVGKDVVLGVRPEDIELAGESGEGGEGGAAVTQALVDYVEATGAETFFHLQTGQQALVARSRTAMDARDAGRRARFRVDAARVHVFDPATSRRIV